MRAGHKVSMEVDYYILWLVNDAQGILGQQLRPRTVQSLNIIISIKINKLRINILLNL
jgi:hypothetical protein